MRSLKHRQAAAQWLLHYLGRGHLRRVTAIKAAGAKLGYSWRTLNRVKAQLGIKSFPARGGWRQPRYWYRDEFAQHVRQARPYRRKLKIDKPERSL